MAEDTQRDDGPGRIEPINPANLEARLRRVAAEVLPEGAADDLEIRHLLRVVLECSLLLNDVYSEERVRRVMQSEGLLHRLVDKLADSERSSGDKGQGQVLSRVRRLPDDVRVIGDKALFDLGLLGLREVRGYDLEELGARAYRTASEVLAMLADDRRLKEFFKQNRLLMLPLEEEVEFLRQCSDRFGAYADILKRIQSKDDKAPEPEEIEDAIRHVPLMAAAAEALIEATPAVQDTEALVRLEAEEDPYVEAARGQGQAEARLSRDELLSAYERIILFSALDIERLSDALNATVIDQQGAVQTLCDEFSLFAAGTRDLRKPPAYFLVGPTGVGKNLLVESLCRLLEGVWQAEVPFLTIEGPNYTYPSDINELRGATRGFIRSDEEGILTTFHERSSKAPLAVILVDEVEKAHPQLRRFFLSILDRGTTTDNKGTVLNFANCMVFFTSNLGYSDAQQRSAPVGFLDEEARAGHVDADIKRDLRKALSPEFINRVRMVHFERLGRESAQRILDLEFQRIARRYREVHGLRLVLDDSAREELLQRGFSPVYGARPLASTLEAVCNVELAKRVRRDDRRPEGDRRQLVQWLREVRAGQRAFDPDEAKQRVLEQARAHLGYDTLHIRFEEGEFEYAPYRGNGS